MCCFKMRCCAISMSVCSGLLLAPAIGLFIVGGLLAGSMKDIFQDSGSLAGKVPSAITLIFAAMALVIGVLGAVCGRFCREKKCCLCSWGIIAIIFTVIFFVFAIVFSAISAMTTDGIDQFCKTGNIPGLPFKTEAILPSINDFDYYTTNSSATNMCTTTCPCATNLNTSMYDEPTLNVFNRTKYTSLDSNIVKLYLYQSGTPYAYDNYFKCFTDNQQKLNTSSNATNKAIGYFTNTIQVVVQYFESNFQCSGLCRKGPFYFFTSMTQGMPQNTCIVAFKQTFGGKMIAIAVLLWVTFALAILAYIAHYGVCCRCEKNK